jgi:tetratricopeptide (TPR) repeat protein
MNRKLPTRPGAQNLEQTFFNAVEQHDADQIQGAETLYRQILKSQPEHIGCLHNLGVIAYKTGNIDQTIDLFKKALELAPDYAEALNNLGIILAVKDRLEEAAASFEGAVAVKPNYAMARNNLDFVRWKLGPVEDSGTCDAPTPGQEAPNKVPVWLGMRGDAARMRQQIRDRIAREQSGVPTFHDNDFLNWSTFMEKHLLTVSWSRKIGQGVKVYSTA